MTQNMKRVLSSFALLLVAALLLVLPQSAFAAGEEPTVELYSPTINAATSNQKIIFSLSESASFSDIAAITITPAGGGASYTAMASAGTLVGSSSTGLWYAVYPISSFVNGTTLLALSGGVTYDIVVGAGAFSDGSGNVSAETTASFTTASGGVAIEFTKTNASQSISAGGSPIASGQAVAAGTALTYSLTDGSYAIAQTVWINGSTSATLPSTVPASGALIYFVRSEGTLTGNAEITGDLTVGSTLSGALTGSNQSSNSKLYFTWVRVTTSGDTVVASGAYGKTYTLAAGDAGAVIRLDVTSTANDGTIPAETGVIKKASYTAEVTPPSAETITSTSITLNEVPGYEYSSDGTTFSSNRVFTVATAGGSITLYQRAAETDTTLASASASALFTSTSALSGTITFSGAPQSDVNLTATLTGATGGTLSYVWTQEGSTTPLAQTQTYKPVSTDIGKKLTVTITSSAQSGQLSKTTDAVVLKAVSTAGKPAAPTLASATAASITLNAVSGYQYSLGGTSWQDTTTFHGLVAGAAYTFYQRVAESATVLASQSSDGVNFSTLPGLTGSILATGEARYGITLTASLSADTNNTGVLTYTWMRGAMIAGTGPIYTVQAADIGNALSLVVTSNMQGGSITRSFGTVAKAYYTGSTPPAPTRSSRTTSKIVLTSVTGYEYSRDGSTWQDSTTFSGLSAGKSYSFYQRVKATATMEASPTSDVLKSYTVSDDDSESTSATPTPKPTSTSDASSTDSTGSTTLYNYTLTSDNTRILYSTMKSLAAGNKTQDVVIKQSNVEITFPEGTMTDSYTQLWYDFGTTINNSIAEQTAKALVGDAYVATIHFNYSGELPGTANIRFWLGAENAGKTLYYYRLESDNTLTFMQSSIVDSTGWASVTQSSCSDYVFLNREFGASSASPTPDPSASAGISPTPTPLIAANEPTAGMTADSWFVIAIIVIAVALIVGGIWLYTKSKDTRDDEDDEDDDNLY